VYCQQPRPRRLDRERMRIERDRDRAEVSVEEEVDPERMLSRPRDQVIDDVRLRVRIASDCEHRTIVGRG